ncbi:hypothetical protein N7527_001685 [Penicillium freii]|nr:hypothetical protein N7527_001685 [Penicillium freii]
MLSSDTSILTYCRGRISIAATKATKYIRFYSYRLPPNFNILEELSCYYTILDQNYLADWQKQYLSELEPPTKIPERLKLLIRIRSISIFDLQIHLLSTEKEIADLDIQNLWYNLREEIEGMDFSEYRDGFTFRTFTYLTAGYNDKYRRGILEYSGREQDLLGMLEGFLGRPPNMNALVEGIARAQSQS